MRKGSESERNEIRLKLCDFETVISVDSDILEICEDIKDIAKQKLESLKKESRDEETVSLSVGGFLRESLERLLGEGSVSRIFGEKDVSIPELTAALCYVISKVKDAVSEELCEEYAEE